jgi:cytoskeletal protein CcmA (bactofilin family)
MVILALLGGLLVHADTGQNVDQEVRELRRRLQQLETRIDITEAREATGARIISNGESVEDVVHLKGPLSIFGEVEGDAVVLGHDLTVESGGHVRGDAVSLGGSVIVEKGGMVDGETMGLNRTEAVTGSTMMNPTTNPFLGPIFHKISLLLSLAAGLILVGGLFPNGVNNVERRLQKAPVSSAVWGVFFGGLFATVGVIFALTIVGLPITILAFGLLACASLLGMSALTQLLGRHIVRSKNTPTWVPVLVGTLLFGAIFALPFAGPVVCILALLASSGSAWASRLGRK